jgi:hypothetical protein
MSRIHHYQWYYNTNLQRFGLQEMIHYLPGWSGFLQWVLKTIGLVRLPVVQGFAPMPSRAELFFTPREKLSTRSLSFLEPLTESLNRLDFERMGYETKEGFLTTDFPDAGGCHLRHRSGLWLASVIYTHALIGETIETVSISIWGVRSNGAPLRAVNRPPSQMVDPFSKRILKTEVFQLDTTSPTELFQFFERKIAEHGGPGNFRTFAGTADFLRYVEETSVLVLETGLREGRFIPMTEAEVAALRQKHGRK